MSRFPHRNNLFNRFFWDNTIEKKRRGQIWSLGIGNLKNRTPDNKNGFGQKEKAIHNSGWQTFYGLSRGYSTDETPAPGAISLIHTPTKKQSIRLDLPPQELTKIVKRFAKIHQIDEIGFTPINMDWHYDGRCIVFPGGYKDSQAEDISHLKNCIVILADQPYDTSRTFPSSIAGAGQSYTDAFVKSVLIASYIKELGYEAVASVNDTAQAIPYAIAAGLGEYGRNGLLVNERYGSRVRIAKIFTDMPMEYTPKRTFGVEEFCNVCNKCAEACPPKAIQFGEPSLQVFSISNHQGIKKWNIHAEACYDFWEKTQSECGICIRVCPFNKDLTDWRHRVYNKVLFKPLVKFKMFKTLLWFEKLFGFGKRTHPKDWWNET